MDIRKFGVIHKGIEVKVCYQDDVNDIKNKFDSDTSRSIMYLMRFLSSVVDREVVYVEREGQSVSIKFDPYTMTIDLDEEDPKKVFELLNQIFGFVIGDTRLEISIFRNKEIRMSLTNYYYNKHNDVTSILDYVLYNDLYMSVISALKYIDRVFYLMRGDVQNIYTLVFYIALVRSFYRHYNSYYRIDILFDRGTIIVNARTNRDSDQLFAILYYGIDGRVYAYGSSDFEQIIRSVSSNEDINVSISFKEMYKGRYEEHQTNGVANSKSDVETSDGQYTIGNNVQAKQYDEHNDTENGNMKLRRIDII